MNKYFVNGKFNFNSDVEELIKRKKAHVYLADARFCFLDSLVGRAAELVDEVSDIQIRLNNKNTILRRYTKRLTTINKSLVYYDAIIGRLVDNGK